MSTTAQSKQEDDTFTSSSPASGEIVGTFPISSAADVEAAVKRARGSAVWWEGLGFDGRKPYLKRFKAIFAQRSEELAQLIHRENGKPVQDAVIEILGVVDHLDWATRHAPKVLGGHGVMPTLNLINLAARVEYRPFGVVGVIGPWNYPLFTPMGSISYALAAGNAVVFKPSELTPAVGSWVVDAFTEAVEGRPVLQLVTGFGETGAALCRSGVDKIAFTGSADTGRKVMAACAESLTPVLMECGGKDALIVAEDADLDDAASAAVWGGCSNAGQTCAGVERVYVDARVYDAFVEKVVRIADELQAGAGEDAQIGPITMPAQIDIIREHLTDALERGARAIVGGADSIRPPFVDPVILVDVPLDAKVMRDETFGPIVPIVRVTDADEAIQLANDSDHALGSAVYSKRRGMELARQLRAGMTSVNDLLHFAGIPGLPFGGRGESGFGRIHGADGLREFSVPHAITRKRMKSIEVFSFGRPDWVVPTLDKVMKLRHSRG